MIKGKNNDLLNEQWVFKNYPEEKVVSETFLAEAGATYNFMAYCYDTYSNDTKMESEKLFKTPAITYVITEY